MTTYEFLVIIQLGMIVLNLSSIAYSLRRIKDKLESNEPVP